MSNKIIVWLVALLFPLTSFSTHIVGGVLNYVYNGNNKYSITLKLYRDCGSGAASFPSNVTILVRGNNGATFSPGKDLTMNLGTITTLSANLAPCAVAPNPMPCVQEGVYTKTISLPANTGGYHLFYQVSARNLSLTNINSSCNCVGESFYAYIPNNSNSANNNSNAVFNLFPPLFICLGQPFSFNHSATDADGDSLVYSLYAPYNGDNGTGSLDPTFSNNIASFTPVNYLTGYSATSPLGSSPFNINPQTGVLTCTPGTIGQFVVGVRVKEYRNGVYISETLRDFQFNVLNCPAPPPTLAISNMTINNGCSFKLNATGIKTVSATWTSVSPGTVGAYDNYLSCTSGCVNPTITAVGTPPPYVDFLVCGIANNCLANNVCDTFRVYFNPPLSVSIAPTNPALCNGQTSTTITAIGSGGTPPYTFLWNNVNPTQTISVGAGTYNIKLSDASGCPPAYNSVVVSTYSVPVMANAGSDKTLCITNPVATINASISGASGGLWSGGTGTFSPSNTTTSNLFYTPSAAELSNGSATLYLSTTGSGFCPTDIDTLVIYYYNFTGTVNSSGTPVSCYGGSNGSASVTTNGGIGPYTYTWTTIPVKTTSTVNSLSPGIYSVNVTNGIGCIIQKTVNITQPTPVALSSTIGNVSCYAGSNGSIGVTPTGGNGPYTFTWSSGSQSTSILNNLSAGTYTLKTNDSKNCSITSTFQVTQPSSVTVSFNATMVSCFGGNDATLSSSVGGGTSPYTFSWSPNGASSVGLTNLSAGVYVLQIKDNLNCVGAGTVVITQPAVLSKTINVLNETCDYANNGSATVNVSGGTPGYSLQWMPGNFTTSVIPNLASGNYTLNITDSKSCVSTTVVSISEPPALTANFVNSFPAKCFGTNTGSITAQASGGTAGYSYLWSGGGSNSSLINIPAGTYTLTVTDSKSCTATNTIAITQPAPLSQSVTVNAVSCFGGNNGVISLTVSGGNAPYNYFWLPIGQSSSSATSLIAGTYTSQITDAKGCTLNATHSVSQSSALAISFTQTNVSCFSGSDAIAQSFVTGGNAPYTYSWIPTGSFSSSVTGLSAGTCSLQVTDSFNCSATRSLNITQPSSLIISASFSPETCDYLNDGAASATISGGTSAYTCTWMPGGQTTQNIANLSSGIYTIVAKDSKACQATATVSVTEPDHFSVNINTIIPVSCFGGGDGYASALGSGGTANYTYTWFPSAITSPVLNNQTAGIYSVTASDSQGCISQNTVDIPEPLPLNLIPTISNVLCNGGSNGAISISINGGIAPYAHTLMPGNISGANFTNLSPGTYSIFTNDANNCVNITTISINQPINISTSTSFTNADCSTQNGVASISVTSGGTPPFTYNWLPGGGTGSLSTSLYAGSYTVNVTDAMGCLSAKIVNINNNSAPSLSILSATNISCSGGSNGALIVGISGGTAPYTYSWSPTGGNTLTATNLSSGTYVLKVTDDAGCIGLVTSSLLTEPSPLVVSVLPKDVKCFGGNTGGASASVSGGTPGYTYSWMPSGLATASVSGLTANVYSLLVTDANACSQTSTFSVNQPISALSNAVVSSSVSCFGVADGSISSSANGGTAPYSFNIMPGSYNGQVVSNLSPGIYTVVTSDVKACITTNTTYVAPATAISLSTGALNSNCGLTDGQAYVTGSGGTGSYTYSWSPSGGTNSIIAASSAGSYTITVKDGNNCSAIATQNIQDNPAPVVTVPVYTSVSCFGGNNGAASCSVSGGTGPFSYSWFPSGGTNVNATNLVAGSYSVLVTSANNCTALAVSPVITEPADLQMSIQVTSVNCFGGNSGSAFLVPAGGTPSYSLNWLAGSTISSNVNNLTAGFYTVQLRDSNNCSRSFSFSVSQPAAPLQSSVYLTANVSCFGGNNGSAGVLSSGGTAPYVYNWLPYGGNLSLANGLSAGSYSINITDYNGCNTFTSLTIAEPDLLAAGIVSSSSVTCFGDSNGSAAAGATGGTSPYHYLWSATNATSSTIGALIAGTYTVTVTDDNSCQTETTVNIPQPGAITGTILTTDASCGLANGALSAQISGGNGSYVYLWNPSNPLGASIHSLAPGNYSLLVHDLNACQFSLTANLIDIPGPTVAIPSLKNVSCFGGNDGTATLTINQGTSPFSISWLPSGGNSTVGSAFIAGTYCVSVTDAKSCVSTATVSVSEPSLLQVSKIDITKVSCAGGNNGAISVLASGGTPSYTYSWTPSLSGNNPDHLTAGTYSLLLSDVKNCTYSLSLEIPQPSPLGSSVISVSDAPCFSGRGSATVEASGGIAPYSYTWTSISAQNSSELTNVEAGIYNVSIADANGCITENSVTINQPSQVVTHIAERDTVCFGQTTTLHATATGGSGNYYFSWQPSGVTNSGTFTFSAASSVVYTVLAFDANGCSGQDANSIIKVYNLVPGNLQLNGVSPICPEQSSFLEAIVFGDTGPVSYSWNNNLPATKGIHTVWPKQDTYYVLTLNNKCGISIRDSFEVKINPLPISDLASDTIATCAPGIINFQDLSKAGIASDPILSWNWDFGDGEFSGEQHPSHLYTVAGIYTVNLEVTSDRGCSAKIVNPKIFIHANPKPAAAFSVNNNSLNLPYDILKCINQSTGAVSYQWNFAGEGISNQENPEIRLSNLGSRRIELVATSDQGCLDTAFLDVFTNADVIIPTAFTPNEEAAPGGYYNVSSLNNDILFPYTSGVVSFHFQIFDRWGELIFESRDPKFGWDGYYRGKLCQVGVYVWKANIELSNGTLFNKAGNVSLLR